MRERNELYGRIVRAYGDKKGGGGPAISVKTGILSTLFGYNQPYSDALQLDCETVLELIEMKLDEQLSYLDEEKGRLARKEIAIVDSYGSVAEYTRQMMRLKVESVSIPEPEARKEVR